MLNCESVETFMLNTSNENASIQQPRIPLFRSISSSLHKRQSKFVPAANSEIDQIFVISKNCSDDDNYDSIEVIDERRTKNMQDRAKFDSETSNQFINNQS